MGKVLRSLILGIGILGCNNYSTTQYDNDGNHFPKSMNVDGSAPTLRVNTMNSPSDVIDHSGPGIDATVPDVLGDSYSAGCRSDWDCADTELCLEERCQPFLEVICEEPCPLSEEYLQARTQGVKRSALDLYNLVRTTITPSLYPLKVRLHADSACGEYSNMLYSLTYDTPTAVKVFICMYDVERNERVGYSLDPEHAVDADISTVHEESHLLWLNRARVPYVFQEAFSVGVSHFGAAEAIDDFCHSYFQVDDATSVVDRSRNFWGSLCREYGFANNKIPILFEEIDDRRTELGRNLNLSEVKQIFDSVTEMDTTTVFTAAGMALTSLSEGERCTDNYECEQELHCNVGICQNLICTDSDFGENLPGERGTLTLERALGIDSVVDDRCIDDSTVSEVSCDSTGGGWVSFRPRCPEGTYCSDGACVED